MSSQRKQVYLAVAGSVGLHLVILFAWAFAVEWFPAARAATSQSPDEIKLEVVEEKPDVPPTPDPEVAPKAPTPKPVVYRDTLDAADLPEASRPPKDAAFQSDRNTEAASESPAAGDKPVPTQRGRNVPRFAFDTHPFTPGDDGKAAGQDVPENMPPVPESAPPPPRPVSRPPVPSTPPPAAAADPRDMAMVTPGSLPSAPADAEPNPYDPSFRPPAGMTEPPRPTPVPRPGGYRSQTDRTSAAGGIGKLGERSVASETSPAYRYIASVKVAAERLYHKYIDARADIIALGTVTVRFTVDRDGKVRASHVVSNSGNEALASIALRAIADAKIPAMPTEVATVFNGGMLDMSINFTLE